MARGYDAPWVVFCMKMATMLQAAGVTPVVGAGRSPARVRHGACCACGRLVPAGRHVCLLLPLPSSWLLCPALPAWQLVFDGCRLPAKADTNTQRRQRRSDARERALSLLREVGRRDAAAAHAFRGPSC